jgi:hypothetical protein
MLIPPNAEQLREISAYYNLELSNIRMSRISSGS